ncbi:MAG: hypothetical protein E6J34_20090 [Chloroflexi bacterium]|nr:MAG: hypothetical protein E6J34_20090 [Chloroflexota bacterium]
MLLDLVVSKIDPSQFKWRDNAKFIAQTWDYEHDILMKKIEDKFQHYTDKWVNSPAGEAFAEMLTTSRYYFSLRLRFFLMRTRNSKTKMPTLDHRNIMSLEYRPARPKTEKQSSAKIEPAIAAGIEWSHRQIYDIFEFLDEITETHPIKRVGKGSEVFFETTDLDDPTDIYGVLPLDRWFKDDLPAVRKEAECGAIGESWYSRLSAVASAVLLQLLHIHYEFADSRGKKQFMNQQTVRNLLMRLPTDPASDGNMPSFPVSTGTLKAWVEYFESSSDYNMSPPEETHDFKDEQRSIEADIFAKVNSEEISKAVQRGELVNVQAQEEVLSGFVRQGGNTTFYTERDFLNILSFPPAQGHPQQLSEFERQFANSSIYGQASLMFSRFDQEILRISLLRRQCAAQEEFLKGKRDELRVKVKQYRDVRDSMNISVSSWKSSSKEIEELEGERIEFEKNPVVKSYEDRMDRMNTAKYGDSLRSPFQSPSAGPRLVLHLICTLMASVSDRHTSGFLKAPESANAFAQQVAFSNALNIDYMNDILRAEPPSETLSEVVPSDLLEPPVQDLTKTDVQGVSTPDEKKYCE